MTQGTLKLRFVRTRRKKGRCSGETSERLVRHLGVSCQGGHGENDTKFRKNENVFAQGDVADTVFYVQRGKVKLTVLSEQGKEAVVAILEPGQFFGEGCLNGHRL